MEIIEIAIEKIAPAAWNANEMDPEMQTHLGRSIERFGLVEPLVVREVGQDRYETIGGAQRLEELRARELGTVSCVVVHLSDGEARLLSQALNHIGGSDNLGLRGALVRSILASFPVEEVIALLPETSESLLTLASLDQGAMAEQLIRWNKAQKARLKHFAVQLTQEQLPVIEAAVRRALPKAREVQGGSPNVRGVALYLICSAFLEKGERDEYDHPVQQ